MAIPLPDHTISALLDYLEQFHKWNQTYNLSAIRQPEDMVVLHLLDSLALVPYLDHYLKQHRDKAPLRLADVGTGGGLPGFPLAIVFPDIQVTLLDSNGKKTRFLFQTSLQLGLKNVSIENNRIEKYSPAEKFDIVTSRAFASLNDMVRGAQHLLVENGQYWAMKGVYPEQELADCGALITNTQVQALNVAFCEGERHLVITENR